MFPLIKIKVNDVTRITIAIHWYFQYSFAFARSTPKPLSFLVKVSKEGGNYWFKIKQSGKLKKWLTTPDLNSLPDYLPLLTDHIGGLIEN
jgi:hypothetical protein